ncbi:MAG: hypothetical protein OSB58_19105 [Alphaproteobacteria bacterium]|nr:hypothetical protein [Alphaproteobacteria bacterium]
MRDVFFVNPIYTATAVLIAKGDPISKDRVIGNFLGVVQIWPAVMRDLKANKLIGE